MSPIYIGNAKIGNNDLYMGGVKLSYVYLGNVQIWPDIPEPESLINLCVTTPGSGSFDPLLLNWTYPASWDTAYGSASAITWKLYQSAYNGGPVNTSRTEWAHTAQNGSGFKSIVYPNSSLHLGVNCFQLRGYATTGGPPPFGTTVDLGVSNIACTDFSGSAGK